MIQCLYVAVSLLQVCSRIENEQYLRRHPELSTLISNFVGYVLVNECLSTLIICISHSDVLLARPTNIREFAAGNQLILNCMCELDPHIGCTEYFSDPEKLSNKLNK